MSHYDNRDYGPCPDSIRSFYAAAATQRSWRFIGNPSTGGVNGVAFLPPFWQAIGVVLPPRNGLYLIRNTLYFGGNDITVPIIVLGIHAVIGAVLVHIFAWERFHVKGKNDIHPKKPAEIIDPDELIGIAAIPPG